MTETGRVIVIGSGPSGAPAALGLLQRGIPVTLLESGPAYPAAWLYARSVAILFRKWAPDAERYQFVASGDPATVAERTDAWRTVELLDWRRSALCAAGLHRRRASARALSVAAFLCHPRAVLHLRWSGYWAWSVNGEPSPRYLAEALVSARHLLPGWQSVADQAERFGQGLRFAPLADGPNWMIRRSGVAFDGFERIVSRLARFHGFRATPRCTRPAPHLEHRSGPG